jgi:hypothetical protein
LLGVTTRPDSKSKGLRQSF